MSRREQMAPFPLIPQGTLPLQNSTYRYSYHDHHRGTDLPTVVVDRSFTPSLPLDVRMTLLLVTQHAACEGAPGIQWHFIEKAICHSQVITCDVKVSFRLC